MHFSVSWMETEMTAPTAKTHWTLQKMFNEQPPNPTDIAQHTANKIIMIRNNNSTYNNIYFLIIEKNKVK